MSTITWPKGSADFYRQIQAAAPTILGGSMLVLDPSSGSKGSMPGFAIFREGELVRSGTLHIEHKLVVTTRLEQLYDRAAALLPEPPDVFAIESIHKGMAHPFLLWAVGTSFAAVRAPIKVQVPIAFWKAFAKTQTDYEKSDESDAVMMGQALLAYCRERCETKWTNLDAS